MFVGRRMTRKVITVSPAQTLKEAAKLLKDHRIQHLPVVEGEILVGILSDTDIRNAAFDNAGTDENRRGFSKTVGEVMTRNVVTVTPWDTIEDALLILSRRRFGALPVVEGKKLVGIITKADILNAFIDTLDVEGVGVRIEVILPSFESLHSLLHAFSELDLEIRSMILSPFRGNFAAFVRIPTIDVGSVKNYLREKGFSVPELKDFLD